MSSARNASLGHLSNPLVTSTQLMNFRDSAEEDATSTLFATSLLTQAAGILLRLPQDVIATAIVILQRYQVSNTRTQEDGLPPRYLSAAAIYLAAKTSFTPLGARSVVNVFAYLFSNQASPLEFVRRDETAAPRTDPKSYFVSEGDYERERLKITHYEAPLLAGIGFDIHVALPYTLALTYASALGVGDNSRLTIRILEHLNGALLSPQLLYLTHQPNALATAAIYLAAKEVEVKLVESVNWWEAFDVDREALGFCVMAMGSLEGFAAAEKQNWKERALLLM